MQKASFFRRRNGQAGFTLVEIGVVLVIISLLAVMAKQAISKINIRARSSIVVNDFRVIAGAMQTYFTQNGAWPAATAPGVMPTAMQGYLKDTNWSKPTPIGGYYTWATNSTQGGTRYSAVIIISSASGSNITTDVTQLTDIDKKGDDGNTTTGNIILGASNYLVYVVER